MPSRELYGSQMTIRAINPDGTYGEPIEFIEPFLIEKEPVETETLNKISLQYLNNTTTTFSVELILPHKKMSRKTFKKWLMHFPWIDRNEAEAYCCLIGITEGRISYGATYHDIAFLINFERPSIVLFNSFARQLKETEK